MKVYIIEVGVYEDAYIHAVRLTQEKANEIKAEWDKKHMSYGAIIPNNRGGDGVRRYRKNEARITEYDTEE